MSREVYNLFFSKNIIEMLKVIEIKDYVLKMYS